MGRMNATTVTTQTQTKFDPKLVAPFLNSVRSVFGMMANVDVTIARPYVKTDDTTTFDVSGIVGFSGALVGSVTMSFGADTARKLVAAFSGAELEPGSPDFADAIGELTNMVAGSAKTTLGPGASITVPTVILGPGHVVARLRDVSCVV